MAGRSSSVRRLGESEPLTTGWEPDIPAEDTILRQYVFNCADRVEHMAQATDGASLRSDHVCLGDTRAPSAFGNQAVLLRPLGERDASTLVETLRAGFSGPHVLFSAWPTPDLRDHGYFLVGHPPFMLRPAGGSAPPPPSELEITETDDEASLQAFEQVFVDGYPVPELQPYSPGCLFDASVLGGVAQAWVGAVNGQPVTGSMAFTSRGVVAVENVATLKEARGKGYGAALTATAALSSPDLPSLWA